MNKSRCAPSRARVGGRKSGRSNVTRKLRGEGSITSYLSRGIACRFRNRKSVLTGTIALVKGWSDFG